jgi:multiple sugar transport system ATP-binding protein
LPGWRTSPAATLLRIGGRVVNDVPPAERGIAMVFQSYALYPHMNLFDNMAFGLKLAKVPQGRDRHRGEQRAAKILHIEHLLQRKPKDLSGGQRQRVAIGRAIVRKPEVFLFDEPLSNLDTALRVKMRYEFAKLHEPQDHHGLRHARPGRGHDPGRPHRRAQGRPHRAGRHADGTVRAPCNLFVAGFIGSPKMNFLDATLVRPARSGATVRLAAAAKPSAARWTPRRQAGRQGQAGRAPRAPACRRDADNALQSTVTFVEHLGSMPPSPTAPSRAWKTR